MKKFVQISTDEVYGSLAKDDPPFTEQTDLAPNSPYAASKAAADLLVRSYYKTSRSAGDDHPLLQQLRPPTSSRKN